MCVLFQGLGWDNFWAERCVQINGKKFFKELKTSLNEMFK